MELPDSLRKSLVGVVKGEDVLDMRRVPWL